jgi:curli biogenesis system outer membrane secretion channel CsgG
MRLALAALCLVIAAQAQDKKRVAVIDFEYGTVQSGLAGIFGTNVDVGKGVGDMLINRLVTSGTYAVIERKALDKILAEQNFSNSNRADPSSAAKIGKALGVDAIIIGSVTEFGRDDKATNVAGSGISGIAGRYGIGGFGKRESKAVVQLTARMVNVDTGEIFAVAQGRGESTRSGTTLIGSGGSAVNAGSGAADMSTRNFAATIIGEATNKAVTEIARQLDANSGRLPVRVVPVNGLVADVNGSTLIINVGSRASVRVGDTLQVTRAGREIRDPATGKVLRRTDSTLGTLTITEVDEQSAVGTYDGAAGVKVGDHVKR